MVEYKVADPKIKVIDFGPKLDLDANRPIRAFFRKLLGKPRRILGPDELIQFSGQVVYKNADAMRKSIEKARKGAVDLQNRRARLADTTGRAHASMAAMAGGEFSIEGDSSKMADSAFTGATFSNAHMTSGRRTDVGSSQEEIIVPISIHEAGGKTQELYLRASENHIKASKKLEEMKVSKQVRAKVLHYGIRGGGMLKLSVETIADFARYQMEQPLPSECKEMISQLEQACRDNGAPVLLEARKRADRICYPNTSVFRDDEENEATELVDRLYENNGDPILLHAHVPDSKAFERRIKEYISLLEQSHESEEAFRQHHNQLYNMARGLSGDFPSFNITIAEFVPWRVHGEDKRHRTVGQVVEPIYSARRRVAAALFSPGKTPNFTPEYLNLFFSMPKEIRKDPEKLKIWTNQMEEGISASQAMIEDGIPESDAIYVVSRGMKQALVKNYNTYNALIGGFIPLRMCKTAEPEMREITHKEAALFRRVLPSYIHPLLNPKCYQVGCSESEKTFAHCRVATSFMDWYDESAQKRLNDQRQEEIMDAVNQ
jgi:hypothetical protein